MANFTQLPGWTLFIVVSHLAIGTALGLLYFHTMWRSVRFLAGGEQTVSVTEPHRPNVMAGTLKAAVIAMTARFATLSGILVLTSLEGAAALLATAAGVMAGRFLVMRGVRGASA